MLVTPLGKKARIGWLEKTQSRISITSALIGNIKSIKSSGLSTKISDTIAALRVSEIAASRPYRMFGAATSSAAQIPMMISPVVAFVLFQVVAKQTGQVLDATKLFAALSLVILLAQPLFWMLEVVMDMVSALAAFERIQKFLSQPVRPEWRELVDDDARETEDDGNYIEVKNASFSWQSDVPVLENINFAVKKGQMTMLVGNVASGKTTLLKGLLSEVTHITGTVKVKNARSSWCDQSPWIFVSQPTVQFMNKTNTLN